MALDYQNSLSFAQLAPILEDYAEWYGHVCLAVAYMSEDTKADIIQAPSSFPRWVKTAEGIEFLSESLLAEISNIHADFIDSGNKIVGEIISKKKPEFGDYSNFKNLYDAFLNRLRRIEKDSALEGSGIDEETGFRTKEMIKIDQRKEMERLKRQGTSFALVVCRIDNFIAHDKQKVLPVVVSNIKDCMRNFDDAYYLENGHFLVSLKQTDLVGAESAIERLRQGLRSKNDFQTNVSCSYCVAEPVDGDEVMDLIDNMIKDLNDNIDDQDAVLKFLEISPLQRFMNNMGA